MKYNKLVFGLGATIAVSLASCDDDVEYTPADSVNTPPIYFSIADETNIDLEESDTYFTVKAYRQNTAEKATHSLTVSVATEDGTPIPASLFQLYEPAFGDDGEPILDSDGNQVYNHTQAVETGSTINVTFGKGKGEADFRIDFGGKDNLTEMLVYNFDFTASGEASPYYVTDVTYDVSYTPWVTLTENHVVDQTLWEVFSNNEEFTINNVEVQEHPIKKGLFRVLAPYSLPEKTAAYYEYTGTTPDYLYINATVDNEAYFSDSKGNPVTQYDTHVQYRAGQGFAEDYGHGILICPYSHYLLKENFENAGGLQIIEYAQFQSMAGSVQYQDPYEGHENPRRVRFNDGRVYGALSYVAEYDAMYAAPGKKWELWVDGYTDSGTWRDLGECTFTDGFLGQYFTNDLTIETYSVPIQENTETPGIYRLVAPYGEGTWDYGTPESTNYNIEIDATDPNHVTIKRQSAYEDGDGVIEVSNAAYVYENIALQGTDMLTKEQVIEQGLNDKMEGNVITINHPVIITGNSLYFLWNANTFTPATITLPSSSSSAPVARPASTAPKAKKSTANEVHKAKLNLGYKIVK